MFNPTAANYQKWTLADFTHREIDYSPKKMRLLKKHLLILTDDFPRLIDYDLINECDGVLSSLDGTKDFVIADTAFYIYFTRAEMVLPILRRIIDCGGIYAPPPFFGKAPFHQVSTHALNTFNEAGTILGHEPFMGLEVSSQICQAVELTRDLKGEFVEVGVFSGSSALIALLHMQKLKIKRQSWLLDTYTGFDYVAAQNSADSIWMGTHVMNQKSTIDRLTGLMATTDQDSKIVVHNICTDELPHEIGPIALANIDVDLYEAVAMALKKIGQKIIKRGIMVVEDPTSTPGLYGAYLALNEFLATDLGKKFISIRTTTQYFLTRVDD